MGAIRDFLDDYVGWATAEAALRELDALEAEVERLRAALSRYADHDRACDARENALYACTCGFVDVVEELFPARAALTQEEK